jgi:two-component system sensor histidine kinase YesM
VCSSDLNILQPLVENALVHGIETKRGKSTLIIRAGHDGEKLWFKIIDDGIGIPRATLAEINSGNVEKTSGSGYAIKNILKRLKAYYGDEYSFDIFSRTGFGTVITLTVDKNMAI